MHIPTYNSTAWCNLQTHYTATTLQILLHNKSYNDPLSGNLASSQTCFSSKHANSSKASPWSLKSQVVGR
jgi:hypothetical protein